jgi:FkbM family methyltransferase
VKRAHQGGDLTIGNLIGRATSRLPWAKRRVRKLSHRNALARLKGLGFAPTTIYDIGAYRGGWSRIAEEAFPEATCILFEANTDNVPYLEAFERRHFVVALAEADTDKTFFVPRAGDATGASLYLENTGHYADANRVARNVTTARLDTIATANNLPPPDLIKIDVQGAELDVIAGGAQAIAHCDVLIAELSLASYNKGAPLVADVMPVIAQHGLRCVDICELHRGPAGGVLQADFLFVKPKLFDAFCAQLDLR